MRGRTQAGGRRGKARKGEEREGKVESWEVGKLGSWKVGKGPFLADDGRGGAYSQDNDVDRVAARLGAGLGSGKALIGVLSRRMGGDIGPVGSDTEKSENSLLESG